MKYASQTTVSIEKSKGEIERILARYGADRFLYGYDQKEATVLFSMNGRHVKFRLPLPDKEDFKYTPSKKFERHSDDIEKSWEQACRQRWRALALVIKAKLEAIESGISDFESEFLAHIMLPDGSTVGQYMNPQVEMAYKSGKMPKLLPWSE